ncbi:MAG: peptidyl-prolyl cis-trans isomerase [Thermodesulfobacteriota bacterium]
MKVFSNPLLHFLILSALIYVVYAFFGVKQNTGLEKTIVVTPTMLEWLEDSWVKRWNRQPTEKEMEGLVNEYIRETILYREAVKLELDKDDVIIRRRLAQKFEFITNDLIQAPKPTDEEINIYFKENVNKYKSPDLITFTHIYFDPDKRGDDTLSDAEESMRILNKQENPTNGSNKYGDNFFLQRYYPERSKDEIAKYFGPEFAESVFELEHGRWIGPVLSGYGTHLVYVHSQTEAPEPELDKLKEAVITDWKDEKRSEFNHKFYENLKARYDIIIEDPEDISETASQ